MPTPADLPARLTQLRHHAEQVALAIAGALDVDLSAPWRVEVDALGQAHVHLPTGAEALARRTAQPAPPWLPSLLHRDTQDVRHIVAYVAGVQVHVLETRPAEIPGRIRAATDESYIVT